MDYPQALQLTSEDRLLLLCARTALGEAQRAELRDQASAQPGWAQVIQRAMLQGIHGFVHYHLQREGLHEFVPAEAWQLLDHACGITRARNMAQRFEARRVLSALHAAGIAVMPLKGLALGETVYPHPALRPSADLDLLVQPVDIQQATIVLRDLGYMPDETKNPAEWYNGIHHLVPYYLAERSVYVELHLDLAAPQQGFRIDMQALWQRSMPGRVEGLPVQLLAAEDLILHLGFHASASERFRRGLRQLMDMAETIRHHSSGIDWVTLRERADEWGVRAYVYLTIQTADGLLGIDQAREHLSELRPMGFDDRAVLLTEKRVLEMTPVDEQVEVTENLASFLLARGFRHKLWDLLRIIFPTRARMSHMHGVAEESPKILLYYLIRPFQLLLRHTGLLLRLVRKDDGATDAAEAKQQQFLLDRLSRLPEEPQ